MNGTLLPIEYTSADRVIQAGYYYPHETLVILFTTSLPPILQGQDATHRSLVLSHGRRAQGF